MAGISSEYYIIGLVVMAFSFCDFSSHNDVLPCSISACISCSVTTRNVLSVFVMFNYCIVNVGQDEK